MSIWVRAWLDPNVVHTDVPGYANALSEFFEGLGGKNCYIDERYRSNSDPPAWIVAGWWKDPGSATWTRKIAFGYL